MTKMKQHADQKRHARPHELHVGDEVLVKVQKTSKESSPYNPLPYHVTTHKRFHDYCGSEIKHHTQFVVLQKTEPKTHCRAAV